VTPQLISIVIPAFNELHFCKQCVQTVLDYTRQPYELILVDNGSTDGVGEFFDSIPEAKVIHSGRNLGFAGGVNLGMRAAQGHVLLLNSDTLAPKHWLEPLETALLSSDDIGAVGPMSNFVSGEQWIPNLLFNSQDEINEYAQDLAIRNKGVLIETNRLVGFCMLIRDNVFKEVGYFDEAFGIGGYEDDDYGIRILKTGRRLCIAEDAFVFHYGSRTFVGMGITQAGMEGLLAANEKRLALKLGEAETTEARERSLTLNVEAREAALAGDISKALHLLREAMRLSPSLADNYNDFGALLWAAERHEKAFEYFIRAVALNPQYPEARQNLGTAAKFLGRTKEAESLMNGWSE
jgi:tetratricopeptide (TPR) repeat protein